jgi:hypothetical protein
VTLEKNPDLEVIVSNLVSLNRNQSFRKFTASDKPLKGLDFLKQQLSDKAFNVGPVLYICKRAFLIDNNLFFAKGRIIEDQLMATQICLKAEKMMAIDFTHYYYNYCISDESISSMKDKTKYAEDLIYCCSEINKLCNGIADKKLKSLLADRVTYLYIRALVYGKCYKKSTLYLIDKSYFNNKFCSWKYKVISILFNINARLCCLSLVLLLPLIKRVLGGVSR